jgi:hypothetical protein
VLGNVSNVAAQLPVPVRPFFQREKNLRRPSTDKNRARLFDASVSRYTLVFVAHEINLTLNVEMLGVTSVAGFRSAQAQSVVRAKLRSAQAQSVVRAKLRSAQAQSVVRVKRVK